LKEWSRKIVKRKKYVKKISTTLILVAALSLSQGAVTPASKGHKDTATSINKAINVKVQRMISSMSDKEKIGQLVMPSTRYQQTSKPSDETRQLIQEYHVGSVINYGKADAETTAKLNNQLQKWATETRLKIPLFISADLEYGSAQLVTNGTAFPRQMALGATRDLGAAVQAAKINAIESKAVGFNWNYSPLADVNTNPSNPVIGVRSFGEKTDLVSQMTVAQIKGYQQNGLIATAKHFPGHGDTIVDSHLRLAEVTYDRKTLDEVHLPPFKAAMAAGVDSIMTAHVIITAIDPKLPATLSKKVLTGLLRKQMGFNGIIVTDSMSMDAIDQHWGTGQAAIMAINAGADIVMATGSYKRKLETYNSLYHALKSGELTEKRVNESLNRILSAKLKYDLFNHRFVDPTKASKVVNTPSHKQAAAEVARKSITLLKNDGVLPFNAKTNQTTLVVGPKIYGSAKYIDAITKVVENKASGKVFSSITSTNSTSVEIVNATELAKKANRIIVATFSPSIISAGQIKLVKALQLSGKPMVVLSLGLPFDIKNYPNVGAYLATYAIDRWGSPVPTSWNAAIDVIFSTQPGGKLPVNIKGFYQFGEGLRY
jgi:beta-N-acetylhexosaminidase